MKISAIIVAAGSSRRMGFDKLGANLCGKPVLAWSMEAFSNCEAIDGIRVVTSEMKFSWVSGIVEELGISKFNGCVEGGAERHLSVWNGLESLAESAEYVAIHDGARPLITAAAIEHCAAVCLQTGAASLAHRVTETLKRAGDDGRVSEEVCRDNLWAMETPQIFRIDLLRQAYRKILDSGKVVTDEVSAVQAMGHPVNLAENREANVKITVPSDLEVAEAILRAR